MPRLVLSRKPNESITIGEAVITVKRVGKGTVTLSISAPRTVRILRSELEPRKAG